MVCQMDTITGEVPSIPYPILKTASKYGLTYLLSYCLTTCLRYADDFSVYSQLPPPIC